MALVVFFLVVVFAIAGDDLHRRWLRSRMANPPPLARRLPAARLRKVAVAHLMVAAVLLVTYGDDWTMESVGIRASAHWAEVVLAGELAFLGLAAAYGLTLRALGRLAPMRTAANRGNLRAWPRSRRDKWIAAFCFMVLNPFNEELVMRGILIHQWGQLLGSPLLPITIGFALNATMHWYQGARMQAWHALFFATAVGLLYSPWGLAAAITAHVIGDVFPFLYLRHNLRRARKEQSRKFQAAK